MIFDEIFGIASCVFDRADSIANGIPDFVSCMFNFVTDATEDVAA